MLCLFMSNGEELDINVPQNFSGQALQDLLKPIPAKEKPQRLKATSFTVPLVRSVGRSGAVQTGSSDMADIQMHGTVRKPETMNKRKGE